MTLYQLVAKGKRALFESAGKMSSKCVYTDRQKAEEHIESFTQAVTTPFNEYDLSYLDREGLRVDIIELELVD